MNCFLFKALWNQKKNCTAPYNATIGGKEYHYLITQKEENFGIEQDGLVIAEVVLGAQWQQLSGEPLSKELLDSICDHIEAHYD